MFQGIGASLERFGRLLGGGGVCTGVSEQSGQPKRVSA